MADNKKIKTALVSVYHKENLQAIINKLNELNINIISTGGTKSFIEEMGVEVSSVESLTGYPSILGGRVKTLHPKIFGGILSRRDYEGDVSQLKDLISELLLSLIFTLRDMFKGAQKRFEKIDLGFAAGLCKNFNIVYWLPNEFN